MASEWFEKWFDSPYYHLLYQNHDSLEAHLFINELLRFLQPPVGTHCLDLACGNGRHAVFLAQHGLHVIGLDLSEQSIKDARQYESENLKFYSHDMRQPFHSNYFDYVFNFFTSFGYFKTQREHLSALKNISKSLRPNGTFIIDFLNPAHVRSRLVRSETVERENITFRITRRLTDNTVRKTVRFSTTDGRRLRFQEEVFLFERDDFATMFAQVGLGITDTFGDYALTPYSKSDSPRMILIAKKSMNDKCELNCI